MRLNQASASPSRMLGSMEITSGSVIFLNDLRVSILMSQISLVCAQMLYVIQGECGWVSMMLRNAREMMSNRAST